MNRSPLSLILLAALLSLTACAHYDDVRPGDNGTNEVVIKTDRKNEGFKEAFSQAKDYCSDVESKKPKKVSEKSVYIGKNMDEETYNKTKSTNDFITKAGEYTAVFGGKKESKHGNTVAGGGYAADDAIGKNYEYHLVFKCK